MASGSRGQGPESCKLSRLVIAEAEGAELRASSAVALGSLTVVCTGRGPKGTRVRPCDMLCMTAQMQLLCARMYHGQQPYKVRQMGTASVLQSSGIRDQGLMRGIKGWGVFCHALCVSFAMHGVFLSQPKLVPLSPLLLLVVAGRAFFTACACLSAVLLAWYIHISPYHSFGCARAPAAQALLTSLRGCALPLCRCTAWPAP